MFPRLDPKIYPIADDQQFAYELLAETKVLFFFQAEDGIRDHCVTGVQTCALPISRRPTIRRPSQAGNWPTTVSGSRSEEHTSELQSHSDLVCRLLLEKKKKKN